ncbi:MAG: alpha/beta fold hydrolase [Spirochaetes bacterium]|nr:alpha/beta fold hydrolase [Spirochaetota bacterium]MBN2770347.1 alpha/beta fold hydrolase [Spirochaetota bacterium]
MNMIYKPGLLFKNPHINTIYASRFRKVDDVYTSKFLLELADGDFLNIDTRIAGSRRAIVIVHGLGGHSKRTYVMGLAKTFINLGYDIFGVNLRGCGGETNRLIKTYHAGKYDDVDEIVKHISAKYKYQDIGIAGFSLGGVITSRYFIESGSSSLASFGIAISAPFDLATTSELLSNSRFYMSYFLKKLKREMQKKADIFDEISMEDYDSIKTFAQYDDRYTAPLNGFQSAVDYWKKSSTASRLETIKKPFLIISSEDDPVLSRESLPYGIDKKNSYINVQITKYGGHTGFLDRTGVPCWHEKCSALFTKKIGLTTNN